MTYNFSNKPHQDSVINMITETFVVIDSMTITSKLILKEKETDSKYSRLLFQNVCDVEKLLNGMSGNFVAKALIESMKKSSDFELKFPLKKVKKLRLFKI